MNKHALIDTLIALLGLAFASGIFQPINHEPLPEPVPCRICVPMPPPPGAVLWI